MSLLSSHRVICALIPRLSIAYHSWHIAGYIVLADAQLLSSSLSSDIDVYYGDNSFVAPTRFNLCQNDHLQTILQFKNTQSMYSLVCHLITLWPFRRRSALSQRGSVFTKSITRRLRSASARRHRVLIEVKDDLYA